LNLKDWGFESVNWVNLGLGPCSEVESCAHSNERKGSINDRDFLDHLSD